MSTILKALKRIDQTTPPSEDLQAWPRRIDTKEVVKGRLHKRWLSRKVVGALFLAVVFIAAGWLIYSQQHLFTSKGESQKAPVFHAKLHPPALQSEGPAPQKSASPNRQKSSSNVKSARIQTDADRPSGAPSRSSSGQKNQANRMQKSTSKAQAPGPASETGSGISSRPVTAAKSSDQSSSPPKTAPAQKSSSRPAQDPRSYRRLDDPKIKLQAIAWSNNAAQRIAVVNNRVVREGESVEGYSVNQIRQEDVVVNDGTQSWRLEFGLK